MAFPVKNKHARTYLLASSVVKHNNCPSVVQYKHCLTNFITAQYTVPFLLLVNVGFYDEYFDGKVGCQWHKSSVEDWTWRDVLGKMYRKHKQLITTGHTAKPKKSAKVIDDISEVRGSYFSASITKYNTLCCYAISRYTGLDFLSPHHHWFLLLQFHILHRLTAIISTTITKPLAQTLTGPYLLIMQISRANTLTNK